MQNPYISDLSGNTISMTQVRQDIDVLGKMLEKHGEVNVLKGQKIFFKAIDPNFEAKRRARIKKAIAEIREFAKQHKPKPGEKPLSQWLIEERDRMRNPKYYE